MSPPVVCASAIQQLRLKRGLSVAQLAARSGLPQSVLYRLENGETTRPYVRTLTLLAKALKVDPAVLLTKDVA